MNLLLGVAVMLLCLLLQAVIAGVAVRWYAGQARDEQAARSLPASFLLLSGVMLLLLFGNLVQIGLWAALFLWLGEFAGFLDAYYHSAVNFATLGYGDIVMSETHRILGPLEAVNGVLMIGVSTAVLMSALQDLRDRRRPDRIGGD